jgi:hypothetical protein
LALEKWGLRENPPYSTWQLVSRWTEGLAIAPWQAPSVPFEELSDRPNYEVRIAEIPDSGGIEVFYRREFDGEIIDLIWVGRLPES